jgi:hypothetical protein
MLYALLPGPEDQVFDVEYFLSPESTPRSLSYGGGMEKVKRYTFTALLVLIVFVTLQLFILNPAVAGSDCNIVCQGGFVIDDLETSADLEALSGCTTVTGDLSIEYSPLTSLEGLECLAHVGGRLDIKLNESLTSLIGLDRVEYVGGDLGISVNRSLTGLAGLNSLEAVGGRLVIEHNDSLTSLTGLNNLESVGGSLDIERNDSLTSLAGFENITSIGEDLEISYNFSLTSLVGLHNLKSVGGSLDISVNRSLTSLAGLNNLESIGGNLVIWYNRKLCTSLAEALRDGLLDSGGTGGSINISINKPGC